jgi:hypothetical protein
MKTILLILFILAIQGVYGQSTRAVIESPRCKEGSIYFNEKLEMSFSPGKVPFIKTNNGEIISVKKTKDQMRANQRAFTIYVKAYNPLNYSFNSSSKVVVDSMNHRLNEAIGEMLETFSAYSKNLQVDPEGSTGNQESANLIEGEETNEATGCPYDKDLNVGLLAVLGLLRKEQSRSKEYIEWSEKLISLPFLNDEETKKDLDQMEVDVKNARKYYDELYFKLDSIRTEILKKLDDDKNKIECTLSLEVWLTKTNRIKGLVDDQKKYLNNFEQLLQKVQKEIQKWKLHGAPFMLNGIWFFSAETEVVSRDSSVVVNLKMIRHLTSIDEKGNIKQVDPEEVDSKSVQFMWYRTFIPEVSAGVYYSLQSQDSYSMADDGSGGGTIVQIGQRTFEGIAFSSMLNFYMNIQDSKVLPFWQVGLGLQKEMPLFMCGLGTRFGLKDRAFSLSCGISITAIKGLNNLNVGDAVKDAAEIKSDLRYQFSGPKFYFGVQFHF